MLIAYRSGSECLLIRNGECTVVPPRFDVSGDTILIIDPENSLMDVTRLTGDPDHAPALIERSLRSQGSLDSEGMVVTHAASACGRDYDVLFTAYTSSWWKELQAWARGQRHQVALLPVLALLWRSLAISQSLIYRSGPRFIFLANCEGRPLIESTQAFSESSADLASATGLFGETIKSRLSRESMIGLASQKIVSVTWYSSLSTIAEGVPTESDLMHIFSRHSGLPGVLAEHVDVSIGGGTRCTCLPAIARHFSTRLMSNSAIERTAVLAKQGVPALAALAITVASVAIANSIFNCYASFEHRVETEQALARAKSLEVLISDRSKFQKPLPLFDETVALVDRLSGLLDRPDPNSLAHTLKRASAYGVRVVRLYTSSTASAAPKAGKPHKTRVLVDAVLEPKAGLNEQEAIARFVASVQSDGYVAVAVDASVKAIKAAGSGTILSYELKRKVTEGSSQ